VKTQYEVEMQDTEAGVEETIYTNDEEEDVIVIWKTFDGTPMEAEIRTLAENAERDVNDKAVLKYYR